MAGILAELVIRELESQLNPDLVNEFLLYSRYVDDIFILWNGAHKSSLLLKHFSRSEYGLSLKLTQTSRSVVNFLDIKIIASGDHFDTTVYTKPTAIPVIIPR